MAGRGTGSDHSFLIVCVASAAWAFSFGLGAPLASLWLRDAGQSDTVIGLNTACHYLGIAAAAGLVPPLLRRWGHRCTIVGLVVSGLTVALFPWGHNLTGWFALRLLDGAAGALSLIPMETEINQKAPPEQRARRFGTYALAVALGLAAGTVVGLPLYPVAPRTAFVLGGLLALAAAFLVAWSLPSHVSTAEEEKDYHEIAYGRNILSYGSAWVQGFLEGGMVGHLAVYLMALGLSESAVSGLLGAVMLGVIAAQLPLTALADRLGRTRVLLACYAVCLVALAVLPFLGPSFGLAALLLLSAACSAALYPLGLALLGERAPAEATARANARFLACNCLGSLTGPALCGLAMDRFGKPALFLTGEAALVVVLATWIIRRRVRARRAAAEGAVAGRRAA